MYVCVLFVFRSLELLFGPGESVLNFSVAVFDDSIPEINENFTLSLSNPVGGARLDDSQTSVGVVILSNDDAHGVIGFSTSSLSRVISEESSDVTVTLGVQRNAGIFGQVVVEWALSGVHQLGEVSPSSGQVCINTYIVSMCMCQPLPQFCVHVSAPPPVLCACVSPSPSSVCMCQPLPQFCVHVSAPPPVLCACVSPSSLCFVFHRSPSFLVLP